jgi:DNA-directed RNA polymerase sigma subunit (sigma70/sigma32)
MDYHTMKAKLDAKRIERDREIVRSYREKGLSLAALARIHNLTRERVRQIVARGMP